MEKEAEVKEAAVQKPKAPAKKKAVQKPEEAPAPQKPKAENLSITNLADMSLLSKDLAKFIKENRLFQNIQGKEYVNVEGWQYAGNRLQIIPRCVSCEDRSTADEIKYISCVELTDMSKGVVIGQGFAVCSNKEQGRKYYQEFAIASMSQTRATGKAFRNVLAFVIRMAGFEPTPAEEMDYTGNDEKPKAASEPKKEEAPKIKPVSAEEARKKLSNEPAPDNTEEAAPVIKYASAKQKEEIIRLLNNPVITRQEKTKMLLNINRLDEERAGQAIDKLKKVIEEREDGQSAAS